MIVFVTALLFCGVTAFVLPSAADDVPITNRVGDVHLVTNGMTRATNDLVTASSPKTNYVAKTEFNEPSVFVVFGNSPIDTFDLEDWAESLIPKKQGLYVKNGYILALVKAHDEDENNTAFRRMRNQFLAYKMLREHFPDLPPRIENLSTRILIDESDGDFGNVFIVMFKEVDVRSLCK